MTFLTRDKRVKSFLNGALVAQLVFLSGCQSAPVAVVPVNWQLLDVGTPPARMACLRLTDVQVLAERLTRCSQALTK